MATKFPWQQGVWLMPIIPRKVHTIYELNTTYEKGVIEVSLWLPWQLSYHRNEVCHWCLLSQRTSIPNMNLIQLKTKELLSLNLVAMAPGLP